MPSAIGEVISGGWPPACPLPFLLGAGATGTTVFQPFLYKPKIRYILVRNRIVLCGPGWRRGPSGGVRRRHTPHRPHARDPRTGFVLSSQMVLTAEQRDAYAIKGFCQVPDLIDAPLLAVLREHYDAELRSPSSGFHNIAAPISSDEGNQQTPEPGGEVMLQRINMCEVSMAFRKLLYHERMLDVAEELMGDEASGLQLFHDQALHKPAVDPCVGSFGAQ